MYARRPMLCMSAYAVLGPQLFSLLAVSRADIQKRGGGLSERGQLRLSRRRDGAHSLASLRARMRSFSASLMWSGWIGLMEEMGWMRESVR